MTNLDTDRAVHLSTRRPVARFVIAQVVLAVLFGAVWWSGLAAPRLSIGGSRGSYDTVSGRTTATVELSNTSLAAVEVRGASLSDGRLTLDSVSVGGRDLAGASRRLAGGDSSMMVIRYTCRIEADVRRPSPASPPDHMIRLHVTVGTAIGLERTLTVGSIVLFPGCR